MASSENFVADTAWDVCEFAEEECVWKACSCILIFARFDTGVWVKGRYNSLTTLMVPV